MKIYLENLKANMNPYNGKGKFIQRLAKQFRKMPEVEIVDSPIECDINFSMNHMPKTRHGKKVVRLDGHNFTLEKESDIIKDKKDFEKTFRKADGLVFQSRGAWTNLIKYVGSKDISEETIKRKSIIIPNGVDPEEFNPESGYFVFAHQVMHGIRNLELLLETWKEFEKYHPNVWLKIYYDNERSGLIKTLLKPLYVNVCLERELLQGLHLKKALRNAVAVINLTENDACPNLLIEAIACGTPIIALKSNGIWEQLDNKRGMINKDKKELFNAMESNIKKVNFPEKYHIRNVAMDYYLYFEDLLS